MKRSAVIAVFALFAVLVCVGCSGKKAETAEAAPVVPITFKYWGSEQTEVMEQIANDFNVKNPSIKAEAIYEPMDQYWTKLIASIAANAPTSDVGWVNPTYAVQMMGNNQLVDVSDLYDSGKVDKSKFTPAAIGSYTWEDKIYAVPKDFQTVCLIYNKGIFDDAGVPYPTDDWTWDDLLAASQAIVKKDANGDITRYGFTHNFSVMSSWFVYCYANGGELFNPDNNNGNYCNTPENLEAFQWAGDMINKWQVSPDGRVTTEMNVDVLFINEMTAMTTYVPAQLDRYTQALGIERVGVAQFPYKSQKSTITNCLGYGIPAGTKNLDAAKTFLTYLGSREGQEPQATMIIPAYQGIVSQMEEKYQSLNFRAFIDSGAFAVPTPVEQYVGNAARVALETEINYIQFGEKTAAQALADAEANIRKLVADEKARRGIN